MEEKKGLNLKDNRRHVIILAGEYIDSYIIPQKWLPQIQSNWANFVLKEPPAIKTEDGIFLLYPFHLRKKIPIEDFPKIVTIAIGGVDLMAWYPPCKSFSDFFLKDSFSNWISNFRQFFEERKG